MAQRRSNTPYIYDNTARDLQIRRQMEEPRRQLSHETRKNREKARHMSIGYVTFLMVALVACAFFLVNYIQMQSELMRTNQQLMETNQRLVSALEKQNEILQSLTGERSVSREQNPVEKIESLKEEISEMSENFPRSAAAYMTSANKALTTAQHEYEKNERNLEVADRSAS